MNRVNGMNGWVKAFIAALGPLIMLLISFGIFKSNIAHNEAAIAQLDQVKAEQAVVDLLQGQLNRMEGKLDRLLEANP